MDRDRYITLSDKGHDIAQDLNLDARIADTRNNDYYSTAEYLFEHDYRYDYDVFHNELLERYFASDFYHSLQEHEKYRFLRALTLTEFRGGDGEPKWYIPGAPSGEDLFGLPEIRKRYPLVRSDFIIFTGAAALELVEKDPTLVQQPETYGLRDRVHLAAHLGAYAIERVQKKQFERGYFGIRVGGSFSNSKGATEKTTVVGGDLNGDFRIGQHEEHTEGSIGPFGRSYEFAPVSEFRFAASYHSTELEILDSVIKHLDLAGFSEDEQRDMLQEVIEHTKQVNPEGDPFFAPFADYGGQDHRFVANGLQIYLTEKRYQPHPGEPVELAKLPMLPMSESNLKITSTGDRLAFQSTGHSLDGYQEAAPVVLERDEIVPFLKALLDHASSGTGRVAPQSLLAIIDARLNYNEKPQYK